MGQLFLYLRWCEKLIRESEHFHFAGRKSTDFEGIRNVSIAEGLYSESLVANKTIEEVYIPGRDDPYFFGVTEQPKTIQLRFGFLDGWDDKLIDEITRWLNVSTYQPLYFEGDNDKVFYVIPIDGIEKIHNGLKEGYLDLTMRCSSSRSRSHKIMTPVYEMSKLGQQQSVGNPTIKIGNRGHFSTFPEIWIEKISGGNITIYNKTNANEKFEFKNIDVGEKLFIDCLNEIITTDKERTYRYDDFNDNYLELIYGENILTVTNNVKIRFRLEYIFS